jgi:hypothetical protein
MPVTAAACDICGINHPSTLNHIETSYDNGDWYRCEKCYIERSIK